MLDLQVYSLIRMVVKKKLKMLMFTHFSPHPYLFFNSDDETFTFLGFNIDKESRNLIDQQTGQVLENDIMTRDLYGKLLHNEVPLHENFDALNRYCSITYKYSYDVMIFSNFSKTSQRFSLPIL